MPRALVSQWLMLGDKISAADLHRWGLVNHLSPKGDALSEALALAERSPTEC